MIYGGNKLAARTIVWAAGVRASRAAEWLNAPADRAHRLQVEPDLTVPGHPDIFAVGDTVTIKGPDGNPVPGLYAAGACACNIAQDGKGYASGTQLGEGSYFGRRAGRHAAARASS